MKHLIYNISAGGGSTKNKEPQGDERIWHC